VGEGDNEEGEEDDDTMFSTIDMLSPTGHTDAQTLALMLQDQLDAINNEIRSVIGKITLDTVMLLCFAAYYLTFNLTRDFGRDIICRYFS